MFSKKPPLQVSERSWRRLRNSVRLLLVTIFAGLVGFTAVNLWWRYEGEAEEAQRRAENLTLILGDHLRLSIGSIDVALSQLAAFGNRVNASAPAEMWRSQLEIAAKALSGVGSLSVVDRSGRIVHSTIPEIVGQSRGVNFLFQELAKNPNAGLVADTPFVSPLSGRTLLPLGRGLTGPNGEFEGIVVATLEPDRLRDFYRSVQVGQNGVISVLHPAGFVMFREPSTGARPNERFSDHPLLKAAASHETGFLRAPLESGGDIYLSSYRTIGNPPLLVAVSLDEREIVRTWLAENRAPIGLLIFIGGALLIAWFLIEREMRDRLTAETRALKNQTRFMEIFDHAPMVAAVKDLEGRYLFVNQGFEQWSGRDRSTVVGQTTRAVLGETPYAEEHEAMDREVIATRKSIQREFTRSQAIGPERTLFAKFPLFDSNGEVEAIGSIALDITEEKQAGAALERIFETSADLILIVDQKGNFIRVSPSSEIILGRRPEEMEGHNATDFIFPGDLERTRNEMRMARRGHTTRHFESRYFHKDGHPVTLIWTGVWSGPERLHFFIGRDMTDKIKLERELHHTQKMEAIGQLTGGIAHDYNNLLTVILGNAEFLSEALRDRPELHALAQITLDAAERSAILTHRLLAFGRRQNLEAQATDINELIAGTLELMLRTLGEHVTVQFRPGDHLWNSIVDRGQLETAVINLAVNARDAMPDGGKITIETANTALDADYVSLNPGVKEGDYIAIIVSDTGTGMPADVLARVFEPFFTTKEVGKGTGLGLSMIYGFVKQSGGHVSIYSESGSGTVVRLYFPRAEGLAAAPTDKTPKEVVVPTGTETIILVEDDPMVRAHTEKQLRSFGYRVYPAENALEAIDLVIGVKAQLLLTDIVMPGMNGRDLAEEARKRQPAIKVLFTSGYTQGVLDSREHMPGTGFIGKPFRRSELAVKIRELLDEKFLVDA